MKNATKEKTRLYTRLKGDTYYIMCELTDEVYATAANPSFAEVIRQSLENYINPKNITS